MFEKMHNIIKCTRNEEKYSVLKCGVDIFEKSFIPDAICKWNVLHVPNDVIKSSTLGQFRIKRHI